MRIGLGMSLVCGALLLAARPCAASGLTLSVVQDPSSTANLDALQAGQTVMFDVDLSGLDVADGQTLGSLGGTVVFDTTLLGSPTVLAPGPIVPDPNAFLSTVDEGLADGSYASVFSAMNLSITMNGTFFTFDVVVQPNIGGSGVLSLDPNQGGFVFALDVNNNPVNIAPGADLPFTVIGAAVPEPSALWMMGIGLITIVGCRRRPCRRVIPA